MQFFSVLEHFFGVFWGDFEGILGDFGDFGRWGRGCGSPATEGTGCGAEKERESEEGEGGGFGDGGNEG